MRPFLGLEQRLQLRTHSTRMSDRGGIRGTLGRAQMAALETSEAARPVGSQSRIVSPRIVASEASESETLTVAALGSLVESLRQSMEEISGAVASLAAQVMQRAPSSPLVGYDALLRATVERRSDRGYSFRTVWYPS
jgi:hypothetical protein